MAKTVVDSGVIVKWFVVESDSAKANLIYDDYQIGNLDLIAPDLINAEYGNIIWKKQILQGFDKTDAEFAMNAFQKLKIGITPTIDLFDEAYQIAIKQKRSFYDSLYLALAMREVCDFVTADEKFYNAVKSDFSNVILLADWK